MIDVETVTLEDSKEYQIVSKIEYNNIEYLYLSELKNPKNVCIRKSVNLHGEQYLMGLRTKDEFDEVINKFSEQLEKRAK